MAVFVCLLIEMHITELKFQCILEVFCALNSLCTVPYTVQNWCESKVCFLTVDINDVIIYPGVRYVITIC
jgi:hypothetical protein